MIKKVSIFVLVLVIIGVFVCCGGSGENTLEREIVNTVSHSEADIREVMDRVVENFNTNFNGCTLTKIWYDENKVNDLEGFMIKEHNSNESIVILTNFKTGFGVDGYLNKNSVYTDYHWVLVRTDENKWEIVSQGY